jgi:hypothetical protein
MRREAAELGFLKPALVARTPGTEDLIEALTAWQLGEIDDRRE